MATMNKETEILMLKARISKLSQNFDNMRLVNKAKRRLRKLGVEC